MLFLYLMLLDFFLNKNEGFSNLALSKFVDIIFQWHVLTSLSLSHLMTLLTVLFFFFRHNAITLL